MHQKLSRMAGQRPSHSQHLPVGQINGGGSSLRYETWLLG